MATRGETTRYGSGIGTGAGSIDVVVMDIPVGREFTEAEVEAEVRRRGLPDRGAKGQHLRTLKERGYIRKTDNGWARVS